MTEIAVGDVLRRLREGRHLSLRTLGDRTGFSASFLSQVEHGHASPSIASLERIAGALGVTLAQFFVEAVPTEPPAAVTRAGQRPTLSSGWSRAQLEVLATPGPSRRLSPALVTLEPGGRSGGEPRPADRETFAFLLEGEATLTLDTARHTLAVGDAAMIPRGMPYRWENLSDGPARIVVVEALGDPAAVRPTT